METGIRRSVEYLVEESGTAAAAGSGTLNVLSTPKLVALMEEAAQTLVQPFLEPGMGTVGTSVSVRHTAATPVGMKVTAEAELTEIDRRRLVFRVRASDEAGPVGEGTHERFIVNNESFQKKTDAKRDREERA